MLGGREICLLVGEGWLRAQVCLAIVLSCESKSEVLQCGEQGGGAIIAWFLRHRW
jgi:hypothetical protein